MARRRNSVGRRGIACPLCIRAYHDARGEGWAVNHKRIQRLWREEGLRVPQWRRRKRLGASTASGLPPADAPNRVWAVDFQFDATTDGRPVKIVWIIDDASAAWSSARSPLTPLSTNDPTSTFAPSGEVGSVE